MTDEEYIQIRKDLDEIAQFDKEHKSNLKSIYEENLTLRRMQRVFLASMCESERLKVDLKELQKEYKLLKSEYKQLQEDYKKLQEQYKRLDKINYYNEHNIEYKEKCIFYLQSLIKRKNKIIWNMKTQLSNLKD